MSWRDFQANNPMEFMESMEFIISTTQMIPQKGISNNGSIPTLPVPLPDTASISPKGRGIWKLADLCCEQVTGNFKRDTCYWCKGNDFWLGGTEQYPHWICRRCHPPAPGAELISIE